MNLKKVFLAGALLLAMTAGAQTQTKPVLTAENFTGNFDKTLIESLRNKVIGAIQSAGRVDVIDINNETALKAEQERRMREEAMGDAGRVDEMKALMSNCILKGNLDNMNTVREQRKTLDGKIVTVYVTTLKFTLSIVNATNGTLIDQNTFSSSGTGDTEGQSVQESTDFGSKTFERFINNAFKAEGKVVELDEQDAKKVKKLYINLGTNDGVKKGQKVEIFKEVTIAGQTSKKLIGELQIQEVMGPSTSLCKVGKGGDVILQEFNKGTTLPVVMKEQKAGFFEF